MFRRKKEGLVKRFVRRIREYYLYCKVWVAEKAAKGVANRHMAYADANTTEGVAGMWLRFKTRMTGRKFFAQAALCRYARRSGTYKNL
jgi:hypothetical protein